jgi:glycine betaine/proline transport system substrate-binding protein
VISEKIEENVIPDYNLTLEHEPSSTAAMLAEVERLYQDKERFVFPPWCPNPMCGKVTGTFGARDFPGKPAKISAIVNEDLSDEDPVAYAFINNLRLNDAELVALEDEITKAGDDPVKGAKAWLENNRDVVQPAIDAAKQAQ